MSCAVVCNEVPERMPVHAQGDPLYHCAAGDRYEGEWADGREHGVGTAIGVDGSRFYGSWQAGKLHGKGVRAFVMVAGVAHVVCHALLTRRNIDLSQGCSMSRQDKTAT